MNADNGFQLLTAAYHPPVTGGLPGRALAAWVLDGREQALLVPVLPDGGLVPGHLLDVPVGVVEALRQAISAGGG